MSLGYRLPYEIVFQYKLDLARARIFNFRVQVWLPPQEREGKLADRTRAGRYVGHSDSDSLCIVLDKKSIRLFQRSTKRMFESLGNIMVNMSAEPPEDMILMPAQ